MFHLLPEEEKKLLKREYFYRLLFVILCFIFAIEVIASAFLLPSYLLSYRKVADLNDQSAGIKTDIATKTDPNLAKFLTSLKGNLSALKIDNKTGNSSFYIKEITDKKTSGITVNQFFVNYGAEGSTILIKGNANKRDDLTQFYHSLQTIKDFTKVELPISAFAADRDIDFTMTLTLKS
ncbi:MAG TPA: hypothetical protein VFA52_03160 [Candidatus Paceibacterota bacterium]|nr:hypothetical protein [Candidatus Paceibacterota bacterium]